MSSSNRIPQKQQKPIAGGPKLTRADYARPRPVRFPVEEDKQLEVAASRLGLSVAQLIRLCVQVVDPRTLSPEMCNLASHLRKTLKEGLNA